MDDSQFRICTVAISGLFIDSRYCSSKGSVAVFLSFLRREESATTALQRQYLESPVYS
jgi:hypothetical protein